MKVFKLANIFWISPKLRLELVIILICPNSNKMKNTTIHKPHHTHTSDILFRHQPRLMVLIAMKLSDDILNLNSLKLEGGLNGPMSGLVGPLWWNSMILVAFSDDRWFLRKKLKVRDSYKILIPYSNFLGRVSYLDINMIERCTILHKFDSFKQHSVTTFSWFSWI